MGLNEKLGEDLRAAMKGGDRVRVDVLRLLMTRLKEAAVAKREDLTDQEVVKVISTESKRRKEAVDLFEKGGRGDLADREKAEIGILEGYLPPQLTEAEIRTIAEAAIEEVGAVDPRDMGNVMKAMMPKVAGRAEGSLVSKTVRELLSQAKD
jgi:hypothetical protein